MKTIQNSLWDKQRPKLVLYTRAMYLGQHRGQQEERRHKAFLRCSNHENFKAGFNSQSIRNIAKCRDNDISLRSMWLANRAVTIVLTNRSARTDNYNDDHSRHILQRQWKMSFLAFPLVSKYDNYQRNQGLRMARIISNVLNKLIYHTQRGTLRTSDQNNYSRNKLRNLQKHTYYDQTSFHPFLCFIFTDFP